MTSKLEAYERAMAALHNPAYGRRLKEKIKLVNEALKESKDKSDHNTKA